jgi:hypothetical protein
LDGEFIDGSDMEYIVGFVAILVGMVVLAGLLEGIQGPPYSLLEEVIPAVMCVIGFIVVCYFMFLASPVVGEYVLNLF